MKKILVSCQTAQSAGMVKGKIEQKTLYWLTLGEGEELLTISVGEKTYQGVNKLLDDEKSTKSTSKDSK